MKKAILFLLFILTCFSSTNAQNIYVSEDQDIWRLNPDNCNYSFVIHISRGVWDIAFDTAGNLYGISGSKLIKINTINGNLKIISAFPDSVAIDAMTISAQNIIYLAAYGGELFSYDLKTDVQSYLGNIGYGAAGDLTFYHGEMYMAATMNRLVRVNIQDPPLSTLEFSYNILGDVFGIVSDFRDCDDVDCFAVAYVQNDQSEIYRINFESKQLEYVCLLNQYVGGGASTTEFMASITVKIGTINKTDANCQNQNGRIEIVNSTGHGDVAFSINGGPLQDTAVFSGLTQGSYWIHMIDQMGCQDSALVILQQATSQNIDSVLIQPSYCNESNGQLSILASGGVGDLTFSLDSISYQSSPVFDQLSPGLYTIWVRDSAGCLLTKDVQVESIQSSNILSVEATPTSCVKDNGTIDVIVDNETGTEYSLDGLFFQSNSLFQNLAANVYLVTMKDKDGCLDTITVIVPSSSNPKIEILDISPASCNLSNGSVNLSGSQGISPYLIKVGVTGFNSSGLFDSLTSGIHKAVIKDAAGCMDSTDFQITSTEVPTFKSLRVNPASCLKENGKVVVEVAGGVAPLIVSLFTSSHELINNFNALASGDYILKVVDDAGCAIDTLIKIDQVNCPIYIPNVFSPNGDGINDNFLIENLETGSSGSSEISIFDRWGNLVYQQSNQGPSNSISDWNGTFKGQQCSSGVYSYLIVLKRNGQENEILKGEVTLIR